MFTEYGHPNLSESEVINMLVHVSKISRGERVGGWIEY